jgi:DNA invertase Pin-like site-specific DNA recombinase
MRSAVEAHQRSGTDCGPGEPWARRGVVADAYRRWGADGCTIGTVASTERRRLAAWAQQRGWRLATVVDERISRNGAAPGLRLRAAVSRVQSGDSNGIVVLSLVHLAGSPQEALSVVELILAAGGLFASIDDGLDLTTAAGRRRYLALWRLHSDANV